MSDQPLLDTWGKICLISWKNWNNLWHHRVHTFLSLMTPSLSTFILIFLRIVLSANHVGVVKYASIDLEEQWRLTVRTLTAKREEAYKDNGFIETSFTPKIVLAFAPDSVVNREVMDHAAATYLDNIALQAFKDRDEMRTAMMKEHHMAGVYFNTDLISRNLEYSLVFPSELRFYHDSFISESWRTNTLFYIRGRSGVENFDNDGGYVGYIREGFASLQNAIAMSMLSTLMKRNLPTIKIQRFPDRERAIDPLVDRTDFSLPLAILVGYLYPCICFTKVMVAEKEIKIDKNLNLLGIGNKILFLTWFLKGFIKIVLASLPVSVILKVHWSDGFSICSKSSWSALLFVLICYGTAGMSFCFLISSLTCDTMIAVIMVGLLWFATYLPFMIARIPNSYSLVLAMFICQNTVMGFLFEKIIKREQLDGGLQWKTLWEEVSPDDVLTTGGSAMVLIGLGFIYTFIGLYFEDSVHELKRRIIKWYKAVFKVEDLGSIAMLKTKSSTVLKGVKTKIIEIGHQYKKVGIEVTNLCKTSFGENVLKNISFSANEGDITVIMGHNGSGKTTLLSIIAGLIPPSSGEVNIRDDDVPKDTYQGINMGVSVQGNILFPDLTVANQIRFYSRLKGLKGSSLKAEIQKYLNAMDLGRMADVLTRDLTIGLKCHLSVCCALCGNSKYVLLDEPSSSMDMAARKKLWDLLLSEKTNRTILITTHSAYEAEVLADHIAILSRGELMCYGSSFFLNTIYGKGYRLDCIKLSHCDTNKVTEFVRNYLPQVNPESDIGAEVSYSIKEAYIDVIPKLLTDLENEMYALDISTISISEKGIEDIFLHMGAEDPSGEDRARQQDIMNGYTIYGEEYKSLSFLQTYITYKGVRLLLKQLWILLYKRLWVSRRYPQLVFIQLCVPGLVTYITFYMANPYEGREPLKPFTYRLTQYPRTFTTVDDLALKPIILKNLDANLFATGYINLCAGVTHSMLTTHPFTFSEFILEKQKEESFNTKYIIGATFESDHIVAWFNNFPLHSVPLSLNMLHNGILSGLKRSGSIYVTHDPLPFANNFDPNDVVDYENLGEFLATNLSFMASFIYSSGIIYVISERQKRFKLLQTISGAHPFVLLLGNLMYDFIIICLLSAFVLCVFITYRNETPDHINDRNYYLVLILFGASMLPFYYLLSELFDDPVIGYAVICIFNANSVVIYTAFMEVFDRNNHKIREITEPYMWVFRALPHFSLCESLSHIYRMARSFEMCLNDNVRYISSDVEKCTAIPNCCDLTEYFTWFHMKIYPEVVYLTVISVSSMIILLCVQYRKAFHSLCFPTPADNSWLERQAFEKRFETNDQILREELRIRMLKRSAYKNKPLLMSHASKVYGNNVAVDRITLGLERGECVGLLGFNGSGKSTLIKILVGDQPLSFGRVYVEGISLTADLFKMYERIGYSAEKDLVPSPFTSREALKLVCHLRGIPAQHVNRISESLAKVLGFMNHIDKELLRTSPGIRRRLSTAISLIGRPAVVYLDVFGVGIDPVGRRQLLNITWRMLQKGTAVVVSMSSVFDCEIFCTHMGFITNGTLKVLEDIDTLIQRHAHSYTLQVKVRIGIRSQSNREDYVDLEERPDFSTNRLPVVTQNAFFKVISFVEEEFPNAQLRYQLGYMLVFMIPMSPATLSSIFKKISRNAFMLNVDTFKVKRSTVSIAFTEQTEKDK